MNPEIFTDYLRSIGYHGVYSQIYTNNNKDTDRLRISLHTHFWTKERPIFLNVSCSHKNSSEDEITDAFLKILDVAGNSYLNNIPESQLIAAHCMLLLRGTGYFDSVQLTGRYLEPIAATKQGIEYRVRIIAHSQDIFDGDEDDEIDLDFYNKDFKKMLNPPCEAEVSQDLRSLKAMVHPIINHRKKMYILQITSYYAFFDDWSIGAALFINCYQTMLNLVGMKNSIRFLQQNGFYDIHEVVNIDGSTEYEVFWEGKKYQIKIVVEDALPCFDNMDGAAFERFCADILSKNGFKNIKLTQGSGDQGVDIIAYKDDIKYGIQCKCYSSDVGNKAVQEVFAGKTFYQCHVGVVLTNRDFTKSAIELAKHNGIILWNRAKLLQLIEKASRAAE